MNIYIHDRNAEVYNPNEKFSPSELSNIYLAMDSILNVHNAPDNFCTLVMTAIDAFLEQLQSIEEAARHVYIYIYIYTYIASVI
jgi:hypothetical protein